jgi:mono/diheme cytochrome c family protein
MANSRGLLWGVGVLVTAGAIMATNLIGFADTAPAPVMNAKAKRGSAVFQQNCVSCHNKQPGDTTPFGPPNLHGIFSSKPLVTPPVTPAQATDIIKKGKAPMPAFSGILTDAQISDLIAYLKAQ